MDFEEQIDLKPERTIILVNQLPKDSRVMIAENPQLQWNISDYFLRSIEYQSRVLTWQNTKDGQSKSPKNSPQPILGDWEKPEKKVYKPDYITNEDLQKDGKSLKQMLSMPVKPIENKTKTLDDHMFDKEIIPEELSENG